MRVPYQRQGADQPFIARGCVGARVDMGAIEGAVTVGGQFQFAIRSLEQGKSAGSAQITEAGEHGLAESCGMRAKPGRQAQRLAVHRIGGLMAGAHYLARHEVCFMGDCMGKDSIGQVRRQEALDLGVAGNEGGHCCPMPRRAWFSNRRAAAVPPPPRSGARAGPLR